MKEGQRLWTRNELILVINLYCKIPFGKMSAGNPDVKDLATTIKRTPAAVSYKLGNFASLDPTLKARGVGGLPNRGELTEVVWKEFYNDWDAALLESERLLAKVKHTSVESLNSVDVEAIMKEGLTKARLVNVRVNQSLFRTMILAAYNNTCCITKIQNNNLLVASHIIPWSEDEKNRLNPVNGLCLNALHDKAFDKHLITVSAEDYTIKVSPRLKSKNVLESMEINFWRLEGKVIELPDKFLPSKEFLGRHNERFDL